MLYDVEISNPVVEKPTGRTAKALLAKAEYLSQVKRVRGPVMQPTHLFHHHLNAPALEKG